jgi:hypothetical protein
MGENIAYHLLDAGLAAKIYILKTEQLKIE